MEIVEIIHKLGPVQVNHIDHWEAYGSFMMSPESSVHPGGVVNIFLMEAEEVFNSDCKKELAIVKTKKGKTIAVSKAVLDAADTSAVKPVGDGKYVGAQPPSTPAPLAAEKPKEAPAAIPPGVTPVTVEPSGAYKNIPMLLEATQCSPALDASGAFVRDNFSKQAKWAVRVTGDALPKGVVCKVFGEADKAKPPLKPGKQLLYVSREENKSKPGQYWYEVSAKPTEGKGGGGGFRADVELTIVAAIGSNPSLKREDWLTDAMALREVYYKLKGGSK